MTKKKKEEGPSPFDFVKCILQGTEQASISNSYIMFIVNRAVAHHRDNIYACQLLNEYQTTPEQHYDYLYNKINKHNRRFEKWVSSKKDDTDNSKAEVIANHYQCSLDVAKEYLTLLTDDQFLHIKNIGGGRQ